MSSYSPIVSPGPTPALPPVPWRRRINGALILAILLALGVADIVPGDARTPVEIVLAAIVFYWWGVENGRREVRPWLEVMFGPLLPYLQVALGIAGAGLMIVGRRSWHPGILVGAGVMVAALRAGYAVARKGWSWRAFGRDLALGTTWWVVVATIALCGMPWGGWVAMLEAVLVVIVLGWILWWERQGARYD